MLLCERKKLRNGRPHVVWTFAKIACSLTKQGSIYIRKGIMDVLEEAHRRKAPFLQQKGYNQYTWRHIRRRSHRHNRAFSGVCFKCDGCIGQKQHQVYYLVMDNAPIHTPAKIRDLVESRHYKCLYLPPYSPFLIPSKSFGQK